jgi:23S rRNA pseudouridine1911/1915/1917 synthase
MEPQVIYETPEFAAILKPAGLQMHAARLAGGTISDGDTLAAWVRRRYPETAAVGDDPEERPGLVHRLDKATSGIVLVARTQEYFLYLKSLFAEKKISKTYLALARGHLKDQSGIIDAPIGILSGSTKRSVRSDKMLKTAVTEYRVLESLSGEEGFDTSLVEVSPKTGRTHQIRVHLAYISHPVLGDKLYGPKKQPGWATRLMLHAWKIEFEEKTGKRVRLEAVPDPEFISVYKKAGGRENRWGYPQ